MPGIGWDVAQLGSSTAAGTAGFIPGADEAMN